MTESLAGSNSTAVGKQNRHCGSRLFTRRRAFIMSGLASMLCWPHFDRTCASPINVVIGPPLESSTDPVVAPIAHIDVTVAVDRDIGRVIKLIGPRMPSFFALAGDVGSVDRHRVGAFRLRQLAEAAEAHQSLAFGRQLLDAVVAPVGDVDVAVLIEGDAPGLVKLARRLARPAAFADVLTVRAEHLQAVVATVSDDDIAVLLDDQAGRTQQFAVAAARRTKFRDVIAASVEY